MPTMDLEPREGDQRGGALWLPQSGIEAARRLTEVVGAVGPRVSQWIKKSEGRLLARLNEEQRARYFQKRFSPAEYRAILEREAGKEDAHREA